MKLSELKTIEIEALGYRDTVNGNSYFSSNVILKILSVVNRHWANLLALMLPLFAFCFLVWEIEFY